MNIVIKNLCYIIFLVEQELTFYQKITKTLKELNDNFIFAIKEASGDIKQIMDIIYLLPNVKVFSGDDKLALPGYSVGTEGTISVASNFTPLVRMLYKFYCDSDLRNCKNLNAILNDLNNNLFIDSNPVPLKYLLAKNIRILIILLLEVL